MKTEDIILTVKEDETFSVKNQGTWPDERKFTNLFEALEDIEIRVYEIFSEFVEDRLHE